MARPVTLYTLQWGDLSLETVCQKAKEFGYDGVELGLPDHVDVRRTDTAYYQGIKDLLKKYDLRLYAISTHLVGQAVCDNIDERHKAILPDYIWGDGDPEGVHQRATEEMIRTAHAAKMLGVDTVVGFTGSSIWHYLYSFRIVICLSGFSSENTKGYPTSCIIGLAPLKRIRLFSSQSLESFLIHKVNA